MNEVVVGVFIAVVLVMIGWSKYKDVKDKKIFLAAQNEIKRQISVLEAKLKELKK